MISSMTAYAQASLQTELGELTCELRSVNHRYLDIAPRMPDELRINESALREAISKKLARGRIDCFIRLKNNASNEQSLNLSASEKLNNTLSELHSQLPNMQAIRAIDVLRWPGILQAKDIDPATLQANLLQTLDQALDQLLENRRQEGNKINALIQQRLTTMQSVIGEVWELLPAINESYQNRLEQKLAQAKSQLDPTRLEQEMLIFMQKTDVVEELDRLKVHIEEVTTVLNTPQPAGRRLDFLMQELNREANTLGAKSQDTRLTKASVDLKVLIEQIREQVQNIE